MRRYSLRPHGATPGVVLIEDSGNGSRRTRAHERDPAPSFTFNAVVEEFERMRQSGRPMLKPVAAAWEHSVEGCRNRTVEFGWVVTAVSEERIAALEESLRLIEARWPAEPVVNVLITHERVPIGSGDCWRRADSAGFTEPTPVSILSSRYGSQPRELSRASGSVQIGRAHV